MRVKVLGTLAVALFLSAAQMTPVLAESEGYALVEDGADLLTASEEDQLQSRAKTLADSTGYDYFIVTTDDAEGKEARDYAEDYYMDHNTTLDGVIYLIDMDNREVYIATSGVMRYYLDDERWNQALDDAYDHVVDGDYAKAFAAMLTDTDKYLKAGIRENTYTVDEDTGEIVYYETPKEYSLEPFEILSGLLLGLVVGILIFGITVGKYKMKIGNYSYSYRDNSQLKLCRRTDTLVNKVVTHRRIPKESSSSGGGGGSHSSTVHTGSGGNSFGGGGRKF